MSKNSQSVYIPITQEAAPLTEDRLEESMDQLIRLGTDTCSTTERARMMSSALLSDMESFKVSFVIEQSVIYNFLTFVKQGV